jgi:hypothetical protein
MVLLKQLLTGLGPLRCTASPAPASQDTIRSKSGCLTKSKLKLERLNPAQAHLCNNNGPGPIWPVWLQHVEAAAAARVSRHCPHEATICEGATGKTVAPATVAWCRVSDQPYRQDKSPQKQ